MKPEFSNPRIAANIAKLPSFIRSEQPTGEVRGYVPHQLLVHLDEHPNGDLEIRYDYPFSGAHPMREQLIRLPAHTLPEQLRADLAAFRMWLRERIKVQPVRIPHGEVTPTLHDGILTVVTRDQRRKLPIARLYCYEVADQLHSRVERESRMEDTDFTHRVIALNGAAAALPRERFSPLAHRDRSPCLL